MVYIYLAGSQQVHLESSVDMTKEFTGKELDNDLGLYYFGARYYDADLGMWISPDPMRQYFSPYTYGSNNPVNRVDEDGNSDAEILGRNLKGELKPISRTHAIELLQQKNGPRLVIKGSDAAQKGLGLAKDAWGSKAVLHQAHTPGEFDHYQHKNSGYGKIILMRGLLADPFLLVGIIMDLDRLFRSINNDTSFEEELTKDQIPTCKELPHSCS